jgi:protocatechuate 3,4-dioxygenase, alpha subunit
MSGITPSQTVGPFFAYGLTPGKDYEWNDAFSNNLLTSDVSGEKIRIEGIVYDGEGQPIPDSMIEIWQADAAGRYAHPGDTRGMPNTSFRGFGRCGTDKDGRYSFATVKPGAVPGPNGAAQAPHIMLAIFARGMLRQSYTRIYFAGEARNDADPILALVPADRRDTLIARRETRDGKPVYRFDIRMQGDGETVFFEV